MKRFELFFGLLRIPIDAAAAIAALLSSYFLRAQGGFLAGWLKQPDLESFPPFANFVKLSFVGAAIFIAIHALSGSYRLKVIDSFGRELKKNIIASLIWLMAVITYYFLAREFPFSRLLLFYALIFIIIYGSLGRALVKSVQKLLRAKGIGLRRILLIGDTHISHDLKKALESLGKARIIAIAPSIKEAMVYCAEHKTAEEVIQTTRDTNESDAMIAFCREHHLTYHFVPTLVEMHRTNVELSAVSGIPLITLRPTPLDGWGRVIKRTFDIIGSAAGLILFSPIFLVIAILIKLNSRGAIFFRTLDDGTPALRVGERGRQFSCLKFRTMKSGTHSLRYTELAAHNIRKNSPLVKIKADPRITKVGRVLRRLSLDELPQLWNVLIGDMSLVGPRPHMQEEVERYDHHHKFVLTIRPGITGLAQVSGRSDLPFEEEVRLDTYYIENWRPWLDVKILIKTILVVLKPYKE